MNRRTAKVHIAGTKPTMTSRPKMEKEMMKKKRKKKRRRKRRRRRRRKRRSSYQS